MSSRFLLPCDCGKSVPVQLSQAGQTVTCKCGQTLTVPTMRGIRQLQPLKDEPAPARRAGSWNPTKGALFGIGVLLLLVGGMMAAFNYPRYTQAAAFQPSEEDLEQTLTFIDQSTAEDLWDMWHMATEQGLGDYESSIYVNARNAARYFRTLVTAGVVLALVGAILAVVPMFLRNAPSRR